MFMFNQTVALAEKVQLSGVSHTPVSFSTFFILIRVAVDLEPITESWDNTLAGIHP